MKPMVLNSFLVATLAFGGNGTDLVVTASWLAAHLKDPDLVILQVGERPGYDQAHIAGARFVDLGDIDGTRGSQGDHLRLEMPEPADLRARLEKLGVSDGSRIVVVQSQEYFSPSTRLILTLQVAGLGDRTVWLDGGLTAWKQAGFPVTAEASGTIPAGRITKTGEADLIVDYAFVQALGKSGSHTRLIDARAPEFFEGPGHQSMKAGHIRGAANLPFNTLVGDDERSLPKAELEQRFKAAGVQPGDTVVAYCHVGQQATLVLFAARVLGHPIRLYDGSMDDWGKRNLPTEGGKP